MPKHNSCNGESAYNSGLVHPMQDLSYCWFNSMTAFSSSHNSSQLFTFPCSCLLLNKYKLKMLTLWFICSALCGSRVLPTLVIIAWELGINSKLSHMKCRSQQSQSNTNCHQCLSAPQCSPPGPHAAQGRRDKTMASPIASLSWAASLK